MRTLVVLMLCMCLCAPCYASHDWSQRTMGIQHDKWFHVGAGMAIDQYLAHKKYKWIERKKWVLFFGAFKEASDMSRGGKFDFEDLGATVIGGLLSDLIVIKF